MTRHLILRQIVLHFQRKHCPDLKILTPGWMQQIIIIIYLHVSIFLHPSKYNWAFFTIFQFFVDDESDERSQQLDE